MTARIKIAQASDVKPGEGRVVEASGHTLALFNVEGRFYVIDNSCSHRGGPLGEGGLEGCIVTCPWHGWRWDITTGANTNNPTVKLSCFPVSVENGQIVVEIAS